MALKSFQNFSKSVAKISGFTSKNPINSPKNLSTSYNIKKLGDLE